jgi:hypothetical protein
MKPEGSFLFSQQPAYVWGPVSTLCKELVFHGEELQGN